MPGKYFATISAIERLVELPGSLSTLSSNFSGRSGRAPDSISPLTLFLNSLEQAARNNGRRIAKVRHLCMAPLYFRITVILEQIVKKSTPPLAKANLGLYETTRMHASIDAISGGSPAGAGPLPQSSTLPAHYLLRCSLKLVNFFASSSMSPVKERRNSPGD